MNKSLFAIATLTIVLTACASVRLGDLGYQSVVIQHHDPQNPNVSFRESSVVKGNTLVKEIYPVVDQEPIVVKDSNAQVGVDITITWYLPWTSDYVFDPTNGVSIGPYTDPKGNVGPAPVIVGSGPRGDSGKVFYVTYVRPDPGVKYKYAINAKPKTSTTTVSVEPLDPTIWN